MIGRTVGGVIQILGWLGAGLAVVVALAVWRLSLGPVSFDFLSPYIVRALEPEDGSMRIETGDTILTWAGWERTLDIRVLDLRAVGADGTAVATIPEASVTFSAVALLQGVLAPKSVEFFGPRIRLHRDRRGHFNVEMAEGAGTPRASVTGLLDQLLKAPGSGRSLGYLTVLNVFDATLTFEDRLLERTWHAPTAVFRFRRDSDGIEGDVSLVLDVAGEETEVSLSGRFQRHPRRLEVGIDFSHIKPAVFSTLSDHLAPLDALDLPLRGTIRLAMPLDGSVETIGFDLAGGAGRIRLGEPFARELRVAGVTTRGHYDGSSQRLRIDDLRVSFGERGTVLLPGPVPHRAPVRSLRLEGTYFGDRQRLEIESVNIDMNGVTLTGHAVADGIGGAISVEAVGELDAVPVDAFARYWPGGWEVDARAWCLDHLSEGMIRDVRARMQLWSDGTGGFELVSLSGTMKIEGMTVDYLPPMPRVENVSGTAKFNETRFDIEVTEGDAEGLTVHDGSIYLTGLDEYDQYADIRLSIDGPLERALEFIDHEPLGFAAALGIDPGASSGRSETELTLKFILENDLTLDQVAVKVVSELADVSMIDTVLGEDVREGAFRLRADTDGMDVTGSARIGGIGASLEWRENFDERVPFRSRYRIAGRIDDITDVADLGIDVGPYSGDWITGGIDARMTLTVGAGGQRRLEVNADLTDATVALSLLGWRKEVGVPGIADVSMRLQGQQITAIPAFSLMADGVEIQGSADYAADGTGLERIDLERVAHGRTEVEGVLIPRPDGGWDVDVQGSGLDLSHAWNDLVRGNGVEAGAWPEVSLSGRLDRVWLGGDRSLDHVAGAIVREDGIWRTMYVTGLAANGATLELRLAPDVNGDRVLLVRSEDAGEVFRTLDIYGSMIGGTLLITGIYDDASRGRPLKGTVTVTDYRVVGAPFLAHLLNVMALTGIVDLLQGQGIGFQNLVVPFTLADGVMTVENGKAAGTSLGFTASGTVYTHDDSIDMEGTVVPAYILNSALGRIPLVGTLFSGGEEGGGVFAATYKMKGPRENPRITVNPLTALAPGFLRNVLDVFGEGLVSSGTTEPGGVPAER